MRTLNRNKRTFYYSLYVKTEDVTTTGGLKTGEKTVTYSTPIKMTANISPATGLASTEQFGNLDNYDKVILTSDLDCPIDENSVLFIDTDPNYSTTAPNFDYIVRRVAKSLNHVSIAVRKVKVS